MVWERASAVLSVGVGGCYVYVFRILNRPCRPSYAFSDAVVTCEGGGGGGGSGFRVQGFRRGGQAGVRVQVLGFRAGTAVPGSQHKG